MNWHLALALFLAILLPVALITTGFELRRVRLRIVEDLRNTIFAGQTRDLALIKLAQARYDRARDGNPRIGGRQDEAKQFVGGLIYALVCLLGFMLLFDPVNYLIGSHDRALHVADAIFWSPTPPASDMAMRKSAAIAGFAFLGGYVFNLRYLTRQTLNQELSALAFVRAALRLVQGIIFAIVLYHVGDNLKSGAASAQPPATLGFAGALAVSFILGYLPDLGFHRLTKWALIHIKDIDENALEHAHVIPLEVIDGIDHEIAFRLQEANLYDVQNLAGANPIELSAETPYKLFQIFDWVLQAQLCLVVGVDGFFELKRHRIRTIFDLERAVLSTGVPPEYLRGLASVILSDSSPCFRAVFGLSASYADCQTATVEDSATMIRHFVAVISDDLHVHRLRALWKAVMKSTDGMDESNRLLWLFEVGWLPGDPGSPDAKADPALTPEAKAEARPAPPGDDAMSPEDETRPNPEAH